MEAESDDRQWAVRLPAAPAGTRRCRVSVHICDRCGEVTIDGDGCTCTTPYSPSEVHQRHRTAVELARMTTGRDRAQVELVIDTRAAAHSTAAAAVPGERAQVRVPGPGSRSRPGTGTPDADRVTVFATPVLAAEMEADHAAAGKAREAMESVSARPRAATDAADE
jgi:hypothetical protein